MTQPSRTKPSDGRLLVLFAIGMGALAVGAVSLAGVAGLALRVFQVTAGG